MTGIWQLLEKPLLVFAGFAIGYYLVGDGCRKDTVDALPPETERVFVLPPAPHLIDTRPRPATVPLPRYAEYSESLMNRVVRLDLEEARDTIRELSKPYGWEGPFHYDTDSVKISGFVYGDALPLWRQVFAKIQIDSLTVPERVKEIIREVEVIHWESIGIAGGVGFLLGIILVLLI